MLVILIGVLSFGGLSLFRQIQQVTYEPINEVNIFNADLNDKLNSNKIELSNDFIAGETDETSQLGDFLRRPEVLKQPVFEQRDPPIGELVKKKIFSEIKNELETAKRDLSSSKLTDKIFDRPKLRPIVQVTEYIDEEIIRKEDNLLIVEAAYRIDQLEKDFNINLKVADEEEIETVGGLVFSKINRIPKSNEEFNIDDVINIKILRANERKILTVHITKLVN